MLQTLSIDRRIDLLRELNLYWFEVRPANDADSE